MKAEQDPPRLTEARDPELAELLPGLQRAQQQGPGTDQLERMYAAVALRAQPPEGHAPAEAGSQGSITETPSAPASTTASAALVKWLVIGALLAAGVFVAASHKTSNRALEPVPAAVDPAPARLPEAKPVAHPSATQPNQAAGPATGSANTQPSRARPASAQLRAAKHPTQPAVAATANDPAAELALLKRARVEVRTSPARALALTSEHAARFVHGTLSEEREVIAIEALLTLQRTALAQQRARAFFAAFPGSAHSRRVRALLAEHAAALFDGNPSEAPHPSR